MALYQGFVVATSESINGLRGQLGLKSMPSWKRMAVHGSSQGSSRALQPDESRMNTARVLRAGGLPTAVSHAVFRCECLRPADRLRHLPGCRRDRDKDAGVRGRDRRPDDGRPRVRSPERRDQDRGCCAALPVPA